MFDKIKHKKRSVIILFGVLVALMIGIFGKNLIAQSFSADAQQIDWRKDN